MDIQNPINLTHAVDSTIQRVIACINTLYLKPEAAMAIYIRASSLITNHPSIYALASKCLNTCTTIFLHDSVTTLFRLFHAMASLSYQFPNPPLSSMNVAPPPPLTYRRQPNSLPPEVSSMPKAK